MSGGATRLRWIWGLFFTALVIGAVIFGARQTKLVVIHGDTNDKQSVKAFDEGLRSGMRDRPGLEFRSLSVAAAGASLEQRCQGVWYALKDIAPTLLVVVGDAAQACLRAGVASDAPRVIVGGREDAAAPRLAKHASVPYRMPLATWSDAFLSLRGSGRAYRVSFLAADGVLARQQQSALASLALPRVTISTRLVTSWPEWRSAAREASRNSELLVIGAHLGLQELPRELHQGAEVVADTRRIFGKDVAATEIKAVAEGAAWAIEPEPGSIGRHAADIGLVLLGQLPAGSVAPPNISIAMETELIGRAHRLPPLFEAVARNQGNIVERRP